MATALVVSVLLRTGGWAAELSYEGFASWSSEHVGFHCWKRDKCLSLNNSWNFLFKLWLVKDLGSQERPSNSEVRFYANPPPHPPTPLVICLNDANYVALIQKIDYLGLTLRAGPCLDAGCNEWKWAKLPGNVLRLFAGVNFSSCKSWKGKVWNIYSKGLESR